MLTSSNYIFDGFCERPFDEDRDGWMNEMPTEFEFPAVQQARQILDMFEEIKRLREEKWRLEKRLKLWEPVIKGACRAPAMPEFIKGATC